MKKIDEEMKKRACPVCQSGSVEVNEIHKGARCDSCGRLIEADAFYSMGIPLLLALVSGLSFSNQVGWLGFASTALLIVYTAGFNGLVARFIPLKHYGDSDRG